ncbi:MAG TPA: site-2 protease family protein [Bryobacteraceae bacterium]|nr:site-2 protease family protein [Bryobacteraceae bacterium]
MKSNIRLGRFFGIEVGLHYSWFLIAFLITMSLASQFRETNAAWGTGLIWGISLVTAVLFFVALLAHEMSHALVARAHGLTTRAITLFALGGVAQIEHEPEDPKTEFWVGIVGPFSSAIIGGICFAIAWGAGWTAGRMPQNPVAAMFLWLGYINVMLAAFNLIPGFPLDGGRILRAIIWWRTKNGDRATMLAARTGQAVALIFIAFGILRFFGGAGFGGLWIAFIGWFLMQAAGASYTNVALTAGLKDVHVSDVMDRDCTTVDGNLNVQTLVEEYLLRTGRRCFVVAQKGELEGLVTPHEIKALERQRWPYTTLHDIMRPLEDLHTVTPDTPVMTALETMGRDDVNQLPVVSDHHLEGVVTRAHVLQFLQTRAELGHTGSRN